MNLQEIASASAMIKSEMAPVFEKIGKGAEWGYGIFVKQAYVNAFSVLLLVVPGVLMAFLAIKLYKLAVYEKKNDGGYSDNWQWTAFTSFIISCLAMFLILVPIAGLIQVLVNPDYAAIQLIIKTINNK